MDILPQLPSLSRGPLPTVVRTKSPSLSPARGTSIAPQRVGHGQPQALPPPRCSLAAGSRRCLHCPAQLRKT